MNKEETAKAEAAALQDIDHRTQSRIEHAYYELSGGLDNLLELLADESDPRLSGMVEALKRMDQEFNSLNTIGKLF